MKIQENYFYKLDNLKEVKVIWKKYDKANVLEIGIEYPTSIVDLDRLLGIDLTEQWLLKFGFVYEKEHKKFKGLTLNINDWIQFYADDQDNYDNVTLFLGLIDIDEDFINQMQINSVHELQNLYFALTGQELTIK